MTCAVKNVENGNANNFKIKFQIGGFTAIRFKLEKNSIFNCKETKYNFTISIPYKETKEDQAAWFPGGKNAERVLFF